MTDPATIARILKERDKWRGLAIMLAIMALLYLSVTMGWMR